MNLINFYQGLRKYGLFGKMNQAQVNCIDGILAECERQGITNLNAIAYILATIYHEVDKSMKPIEEYGKGRTKTYGYKVKHSGKPYSTPNKIYYGRGLTQNTWYENYEKLTKANNQGWDFLNEPELLLSLRPSIWATVYAMRTGLYTGRKLDHYFNCDLVDYINARRIINGTDKAELIAEYAENFFKSLTLETIS